MEKALHERWEDEFSNCKYNGANLSVGCNEQ